MSENKGRLARVYTLNHAAEIKRYYDDWAESYDAELTGSDYRTPQRCADALARHAANPGAPVLDFACGTGLSGLALHRAGFTAIDGIDLSPGMLEQAGRTGVFRRLMQASGAGPLDMRGRGYAAIVACGAIGIGAAPPENLDGALDSLDPGGLFVVSLNDQVLQHPDYAPRLTRAAADGRAEILEAEDGPHLPALELGARVFVLRRL